MNQATPITKALTTNCTIVEAMADIQTIREIFDYFPNQFLPVVRGLRFVGVILRDEFFRKFLLHQDFNLSAKDLISKEMVTLSLHNTLEDAQEIFATNVFDVLPVTDEEGDLMGVLLKNEVETALQMSAYAPRYKTDIVHRIRQAVPFFSL